MLEDIAILTGGNVIASELGTKLENASLSDMGSASRVVVDKDKTTIVGGKGDKRRVDARAEQLRRQMKETTGDYDREKLEERIAKLSGGVAVIQASAPTETELKGIKEALTTRSTPPRQRSRKASCPAATRQIAMNSGLDGGVVVDRMLQSTGGVGLNAATGQYVDLLDAGIVDATKVVRTALENAVSVASVLLLTEATLTDVPEPSKPVVAPRDPAFAADEM